MLSIINLAKKRGNVLADFHSHTGILILDFSDGVTPMLQPLQCNICKRIFKKRGGYTVHMNSHNLKSEYAFICPMLQKRQHVAQQHTK